MQKDYNNYQITTDQSKIDPEVIYYWLKTTYWAKNRSLETVKKSIENSFCFGVIHKPESLTSQKIKSEKSNNFFESEQSKIDKPATENEVLIGFARAVTDYATYALILDVFIHPNHRAQGLGQKLLEFIINHPKIAHTKRTLSTLDAEKFYEKLGFQINPEMKNLFIPANEK